MTELNIQTELIAFFIQDIPESIIMTLVVFSFLCLRFEWRKVLPIAFLQAAINFVRLLPLAAGMHSVILIISLAILVSFFTNTRLSKVFVAVLTCFIIFLGVEIAYTVPLLKFSGFNYETAFANPFTRALFSLPYEIIMLAVAMGKNYYNHRRGKLSL